MHMNKHVSIVTVKNNGFNIQTKRGGELVIKNFLASFKIYIKQEFWNPYLYESIYQFQGINNPNNSKDIQRKVKRQWTHRFILVHPNPGLRPVFNHQSNPLWDWFH